MENSVAIVNKNLQHVVWPLAEARSASERLLLGWGQRKTVRQLEAEKR